MSDKCKKIVAIGLCAALCLGGGVWPLPRRAPRRRPQPRLPSVSSTVAQNISKDETVYVLTGTDGSVQKIIVSDWVKNHWAAPPLRDESGLDNIQNVKGNESYTRAATTPRCGMPQARTSTIRATSTSSCPWD